MGAIDRIKEKALAARQVAPDAIKDLEADLDGILAERDSIKAKRIAAVSPHKEAITGIYTEIDGIKAAIDILSNGEPPLPASAPGSPAWLAANKITPEEHAKAIAAGKISESKEYYEFIDKLKVTNAAPV